MKHGKNQSFAGYPLPTIYIIYFLYFHRGKKWSTRSSFKPPNTLVPFSELLNNSDAANEPRLITVQCVMHTNAKVRNARATIQPGMIYMASLLRQLALPPPVKVVPFGFAFNLASNVMSRSHRSLSLPEQRLIPVPSPHCSSCFSAAP